MEPISSDDPKDLGLALTNETTDSGTAAGARVLQDMSPSSSPSSASSSSPSTAGAATSAANNAPKEAATDGFERKEEGSATQAESSSTLMRAPDAPRPPLPPPLELGWTRVKRRRTTATTDLVSAGTAPSQSDNNDDDDDDGDNDDGWLLPRCCNDLSCRRAGVASETARGGSDRRRATPSHPTARGVRGHAVWCLPESTDSGWFQGYLFASRYSSGSRDGNDDEHDEESAADALLAALRRSSQQKPWGLLARAVEVDDCLACAAGGYRRVRISAYPPRRGDKQQHGPPPPPIDLGEADWTGGDMVRLRGPQVSMQPRQLLTQGKAIPYVRGLFGGLWKRLETEAYEDSRQACAGATDPEGDAEAPLIQVLDVIPDVAVVVGDLELELPPPSGEDKE